MRLKEKLEGTRDTLQQIKNKNKDVPVIVEGKKDLKALRRLGLEGKIIKIKTNNTIFHIIENMRGKYEEVIILTDWDNTGSRLYHKIKRACKANGIDYNERIRKKLIKYLWGEIKDIESLPKFIKRAEKVVINPYNARNKG